MDNIIKQKGLVIVYDPHNLYQFLWYYCNAGKTMSWDALCLPNDKKGEYMHPYCERTSVFSNVYYYDDTFKSISAIKKFITFIQMLGYYVCGQKRRYCHKLINRYVNWNEYDQVVILTCVGLVSGACAALSDEKEVVILEDGISDYRERNKFIERKHIKSLYHWQGFILSRMGYCCPGWFYFKPEKNCIKYSSRPDKMKEGIYKEIRQLYNQEGTDDKLLKSIVDNTYPQLKNINFNSIDAVFFSIPLSDHVMETEQYEKKIENYISTKYNSLMIKRHPRDDMEYHFSDINIIEVDSSIPAEVLMPYLKNAEVVMCESCSTIMYAHPYNLKCIVLVLNGYYEESVAEGVDSKAPSEEEVNSYVEKFGGLNCSIVTI